MSNVAVMQSNLPAVPAHMRKAAPTGGANDDIRSGLGSGFIAPAKLSIEGKVFRVIKDDATVPVTRKDEDGNDVPVSSLNVVVVAANRGKYKVFYGTKYDPKAEAEKPKCYSYDGERPSPNAEHPQHATCMGCPQNEFGSMVNDLGNETRACSDSKILAVIPIGVVKAMLPEGARGADVYSLKVSATALSRNKADRKANPANQTSLVEYVNLLNAYPVEGGSVELPMREVATNLHFEIEAKYPLLRFKLAKDPWLTPEQISYVAERAEGDDVKAIISEQGQGPAPVRPAAIAAPAATPAIAAPAATPAIAAPKPAKPPVDEDDVAIGGAAPAAPAPAAVRRGRPSAAAKAALVDETPAPAAPVQTAPAAQPTDAATDADLAAAASLFG
jgi:hypothetical protein